jgi:hypothetical protein
VDVETLKGTSKVGEPPSHEFNKKLDDRDHVFIEIISRAGISGQTVQTILDMDQKGWVDFLDSLDKTKRDLVKDTPFAKFNVYVDDSKDTTYSRKYYFQGELVTVKAGDQIVKFELVNVNNTRQSVEPENVRIRLK